MLPKSKKVPLLTAVSDKSLIPTPKGNSSDMEIGFKLPLESKIQSVVSVPERKTGKCILFQIL